MGGKKWKLFMAKLYGWGASVVIVGAMFKIQHWPGASAMLVCGLSVEAVIFFFSAFEPPHEEIDWSLVYPELAGMHDDHLQEEEPVEEDKGTVTEQLDKMLEEAKIGPELIKGLGTGLQKFSDQTAKLTNITDAGMASDEFANNIKTASKSVGNLSESYSKAKDAIVSSTDELAKSYGTAKDTILSSNDELVKSYGIAKNVIMSSTDELAKSYGAAKEGLMSSTDELAKSYSKVSQSIDALASSNQESQSLYGQEMQKVSKNLSALNAVYELQLEGSKEHLQTTNKLYDGMSQLMGNLNESIEYTKKYRSEIESLSDNLNALNTIYGNMLSAMNFKK